jgi:lipopolysaccharide transport system permease protein
MAYATNELPEVTYSSESALAHPGKLVREVFSDLYRCRELIWILFLRDLKAQFRQSYLGYVWLFLPPALTTAVWIFLNSQKVIAVAETDIPYPLFVIIGSVTWQSFVKLVQSPLQSFSAGKPVFMKIKVPPEAFIAAGALRAVFELFIYILVLIPAFILMEVIPPWQIILLPVVVFSLVVSGTSLGLLLVPLGSLYSDFQQAIPLVMGFLMYLCPVVYPPPTSGVAATAMAWNPMTPLLMCMRNILTTGNLDGFAGLLTMMTVSACLIFLALCGIRIVMPHLVARMGM